MSRLSKSILLMGSAVLALAACSGAKGPGELGTKNDIVVRNNGLPGAQPPLPGGDVIDAAVTASNDPLAIPPSVVEQGEPLPDNSPEMQAAVEAEELSKAPVASMASEPMMNPEDSTSPDATQSAIPDEPVMNTATTTPPSSMPEPAMMEPAPAPAVPAPAPASRSAVYPAEDYVSEPMVEKTMVAPVVPTAPVSAKTVPAPNAYVPLPPGSDYPLDPNAPYSPSSMASKTSSAPMEKTAPAIPQSYAPPVSPVPAPSSIPSSFDMADPIVVRSAQAALKAKGAYTGPETGKVDAMFLNALTVYQGQNGLPVGGLNMDTLKKLGVVE